ncbi:RNA polymerase sigma factor [Bacteroides sp. 224]|uniref:RNA polymerase sigma factor n=1 Tax=Bacteroides sp. 224 TaxID=2302936 RepID=UPI00351B177F
MEEQICGATITDPELDPKVAERRNSLFEKYVTPYLNMVYKLCINYTYNSANVEENYTEVLVNFYRRIETYDPNRSILTWLHIVTKRQIAEIERKRKQLDINNYDQDIEMYADSVFSDSEVSGNTMGVDNYKELYNDDILSVLNGMKSIHRDAFLLQEAGYSLKEIAEIEFKKGTLKSRNIETVKSRLFLARQHLKNHLTRDGKRKTN